MAVIAPPFVSWQELGDMRLHPQEGRDEVYTKARHTLAKQGRALGWGTGLEILPTASSPMAWKGTAGPATMDPSAPIEEKHGRAEQLTASESRVQPPEDKNNAPLP